MYMGRTKKAKQPSMTERDIQIEAVEWFRKTFPNQLIFSVPLEGCRRQWGHFEPMGALHGSPDLVATLKGRVFFIEMKAARGRQSEHQKQFQARCEALGIGYYVCRSLDEVKMAVLREWNLLKAAENGSKTTAEPLSGGQGTTTPQTGENAK